MKTKDVFFYSIGALFIIGFFACLAILIWRGMPQMDGATLAILSSMFGCLIAGVSTILGYFYGSSKGSADKNDLLKTQP